MYLAADVPTQPVSPHEAAIVVGILVTLFVLVGLMAVIGARREQRRAARQEERK